MKRLSLGLALGAACAWSIDIPHIGFARDALGRVTAINGIAGNLVRGGDAAASDATVAFSWNGNCGIRKTAAAIEWWDADGISQGTVDAPVGGAIIGFGTQQDAWIYANATLFRVRANESRMQQTPVSLSSADEEIVLALAGGQERIDIALRRAGALFVATFDLSTGRRIAEAPLSRAASTALLFLADGAMAGIDGTTLWVQRSDGSEWSADTGAALTDLAWMGREWIQAGAGYAVRLRPGSEPALYALPQAVIE